MKRFRAYARRDDHQYSGIFEALNEEDARNRLKSQGYDILTLQEIRSRRAILITAFFSAFILFFACVWLFNSCQEKSSPIKKSYHRRSAHAKSPFEVVGHWIELKSGAYLIATAKDQCIQAVKFKNNGDNKKINQMLSKHTVGWTKQYGGGQKVYVYAWHETEGIVEIRFRDSDVIAWAEESAVI